MAEQATDPTEEKALDTEDQEEVDPSNEEDETADDGDDTDTEANEETDDESDESDSEDEEEDESSDDFAKRFTQFKGDTPPEYLKNLEDGYAQSSKEAVRLSRENKELKATADRISQLVANNPELAQALQTGAGTTTQTNTPTKDPAVLWAQGQRDKAWAKQYQEFASKHPEIETDPTLADALDSKLKIAKRIVEEEEGRLVDMDEGLEMAWKLLGKDTDDKQEKVRMASKDSASQGKTASGKSSKQAKSRFTDAQIQTHMEMVNVDRNTAIKQLSEHVK